MSRISRNLKLLQFFVPEEIKDSISNFLESFAKELENGDKKGVLSVEDLKHKWKEHNISWEK